MCETNEGCPYDLANNTNGFGWDASDMDVFAPWKTGRCESLAPQSNGCDATAMTPIFRSISVPVIKLLWRMAA
jgi:hypothetical protein